MNKKAVTEKQRTANQKNARKSTGPKTPEGKQVAARNALKHGLLARSVVIDSDAAPESREEFDALLADFVADLKPTTVVEETLVERIATCYWRLRRAHRFEAGAIQSAMCGTAAPGGENAEKSIELAVTLDTLKRKIKIAQRNLDHLVELQTVLEKPGGTVTPEESEYLNSELPDFLRENEIYLGIAGLSGASPTQKVQDVLWHAIRRRKNDLAELREQHETAVSEDKHRRAHRFEAGAIPSAMCGTAAPGGECGTVAPGRENAEESIELAVLPIDESFIRVIRYETMLDRQFHRALSELRKLRRDHNRDHDPSRARKQADVASGVPAGRPDPSREHNQPTASSLSPSQLSLSVSRRRVNNPCRESDGAIPCDRITCRARCDYAHGTLFTGRSGFLSPRRFASDRVCWYSSCLRRGSELNSIRCSVYHERIRIGGQGRHGAGR
jgi:hypothetical protein